MKWESSDSDCAQEEFSINYCRQVIQIQAPPPYEKSCCRSARLVVTMCPEARVALVHLPEFLWSYIYEASCGSRAGNR